LYQKNADRNPESEERKEHEASFLQELGLQFEP